MGKNHVAFVSHVETEKKLSKVWDCKILPLKSKKVHLTQKTKEETEIRK